MNADPFGVVEDQDEPDDAVVRIERDQGEVRQEPGIADGRARATPRRMGSGSTASVGISGRPASRQLVDRAQRSGRSAKATISMPSVADRRRRADAGQVELAELSATFDLETSSFVRTRATPRRRPGRYARAYGPPRVRGRRRSGRSRSSSHRRPALGASGRTQSRRTRPRIRRPSDPTRPSGPGDRAAVDGEQIPGRTATARSARKFASVIGRGSTALRIASQRSKSPSS